MEEEKSEVKSSLPLLKWVPVFALGREPVFNLRGSLRTLTIGVSGLVTWRHSLRFLDVIPPPVSEGFV